MPQQTPLFEESFQTSRPANPLYCHEDFLEKLATYKNLPVAKRASLLMQRLAVDSGRQHYKGTQGVNHGWRRSRLGGSGGSHFYAWWAPQTAAPMRSGEGFQEAPSDAIFLRDIRHHDDHSPALANTFEGHYLAVTIPELRRSEYGPAPWTQQQLRFAAARQPVRILKGHPGSGKTTALLHAADECGARRVLYLTYSRELAVLASEYFERYCSSARLFHVLTFDAFLRRLVNEDVPAVGYAELRSRLRGSLAPFARSLGPWTDRTGALYDEWHAHLVGAALPVDVGRFDACKQPRTPGKSYVQRRERFLGKLAADASIDAALKLERNGEQLAAQYFPELALAWKAAGLLVGHGTRLIGDEFADFDCIAVDECQDLTPLEAFVVVELAVAIRSTRGGSVQVFLAGDEAQTVRPTDFEWGWMSDLLHARLGTPTEFKLSSNLRSPRAIAMLVNQVWGLYGEIEKRDRPSGTGYAEIEDDATDQVLYCCAAPGEDLDLLLNDLAGREGLALVAYDEAALEAVPERLRSAILTPSEVKGLDFHTVCLVNAGQHLERIVRWRNEHRLADADIESIRRRLAIDELRVGISRPADRLIWLDIKPSPNVLAATTGFLRDSLDAPISPVVPSALLTALSEEQLDLEERIQRCQNDARQLLSIRPDIAWSRAKQAVSLLGDSRNAAAIVDQTVRKSAENTLAEISFCLAFRKAPLAPELGRPDLFAESAAAVLHFGTAAVIRAIGAVVRADHATRLRLLGTLAQLFAAHQNELEAWLFTEIAPKVNGWLEELESAVPMGDNALSLAHIVPPFYRALRLPDAEARAERMLDRCVRHLLKNKRHQQALEILPLMKERHKELEAECLEAVGEYAKAGEAYRSTGKLKEALACYRAAPDFEAAVRLIREIPDHPAGQSYEWLMRLQTLVGERPENFSRVMTTPEKKILEQMLEQALGVSRKKPATKKATAKKAATKRVPVRRTMPPQRPK
jgi:hypothetical protein